MSAFFLAPDEHPGLTHHSSDLRKKMRRQVNSYVRL